ncbi:phage tail tape measure protein [Agrobacterium tumefaciens]|uniref:phage tail tape measure protein n=1 Tax=Agrobacterium tumefaciens TaxID=358 RepID=UPI001574EBE7|nr:phage tail tape measure protein [Agrobacterium tumefaciens]NTA46865.1 phage tail tape measure protein [Agrobacterium tumefaciens]
MAASALTSSLVVRLIDQVTAPARAASKSLLGLNRAAGGDFGSRLNDAMARNDAALANTRGSMVDAIAGFYALKTAIGAPIKSAVDFETLLEDIGQKADIPVERLAALGEEIKRVAADTNQATTAIANAVDNLLGRGAAEDVALAAAGPIGKAATAYRAATDDLAAASWSAVDNLKVPADQIGTAIDAMAQAGKEGAFELRDMARFFPSLGAAYQGLGQKGTDAVADLAAALQIVRKGTGDSSTAATNLQNVLQKIGSPATLRAFGKMGVNLRKEMQKAEKAGMTPIEAIAEITNKTLKGDLGKLGFLFEDAQVQAGMRSLIQNMEEYKRIRAEAMKASGVVERDYQRRIETAAGATIRWKASIENLSLAIGTTLLPVMSDLVNRFAPVIDAIGKWASANPAFTRNVITATAAVVGFKVAVSGLKYLGLLGRGGALSMLALGFNTIGKAAIGATRAAKAAVGLQVALGAMSGAKLTGFQTMATALRGVVFAVPGVSALGGALSAVGAALSAITLPIAAGIAAVAASGFLIYKYWDRAASFVTGVAKAYGDALAPAIEAVKPYLEWLKPIGAAIATGWEKAGQAVSAFGEWIGSFFQREVLNDAQKAQWENAGYDAATRMINAIKSVFSGLVDWATGLGNQIGAAIANGAVSAVNTVKGWIGLGGGETPEPGNDNAPPASGSSGHRKNGGNMWRGGSFLVGEDEPEVVSPKTGSTITPLSKLGGSTSVTIGDIIIQGGNSPRETAHAVREALRDEIREALRSAHADTGAR